MKLQFKPSTQGEVSMRHWIQSVLAGLLISAVALGADSVSSELKSLQGEWQATHLEGDGKVAPDEIVKRFQLRIKDDEMIFLKGGAPDRKCKFKLDPSTSPRSIDIIGMVNLKPDETNAGIYSIKDDELTICICESKDMDRPKDFKNEPGDHLGLMKFKRINPK
jgi:uncharacterized protein (TIGR03067 family)